MRADFGINFFELLILIGFYLFSLGYQGEANANILTWDGVTQSGKFESVDMGDCHLESGEVITDCKITYRVFGRLAEDHSNIILIPTWINGSAEALSTYNYLGPEGIVDTDEYFVIAVNALGNGKSSSPSNSNQTPFPEFSIRDQVNLQHSLLKTHLGIDHVHAIVGASMGGYQTYEWLMLYPKFANHFVPIEGTPWPTFYDRLRSRAWSEILELPHYSPEVIQRKANLLASLDGLIYWTPDYLNREQHPKDFESWLSNMARFDTEDSLRDRASQNRSAASHDIRRGRAPFDVFLKELGRPSVLAIVFETDLTVNPAPNKLLAKKLGFEVVEISGDCGHFGPNPECYQKEVIKHVSSFLKPKKSGQMLRREVQVSGGERQYFVYLPDDYGSRPLPVVLGLHGFGITATGFASAHGLNRHANENGYIAVYPQGANFYSDVVWQSDQVFVSTWNDLSSNFLSSQDMPICLPERLAYPCPPDCEKCGECDWTSCQDDIAFLLAIVESLKRSFLTDADRYYLLGNSNGGGMVQRLGCEHSELFAAVAILIYQMPPGHPCGPDRPLPMIHYYGDQDDDVPPHGMPSPYGWIYTSAAENTRIWAKTIGCQSGPSAWSTPLINKYNLRCEAYSACQNPGVEVVSCGDPNAGHEWEAQRIHAIPADCVTPAQKGDLPRQPLCPQISPEKERWGMDMIWEFFYRYTKSHSLS